MSDIPGTSRAQTNFLRSFLKHPKGPPPDAWPSPVVLRRWLKKPSFRTALRQIQLAHRHQADLQLSSAAAHAATLLQQCFSDPEQIETQNSKLKNALGLLRLHHVRQRFPLPEPEPASSVPPSAPAEDEDDPSCPWTVQEQRDICDALDRARAEGTPYVPANGTTLGPAT